jgi:SAM-dependent methyltransferase
MPMIRGRNRPAPVQIGIPGLRIGPADTVVDIGCGAGSICRHAGSFGATVIGIDSEPSLIGRADEAMLEVPANSWRGIVSDCDPIPLPDGTATLVFCTEVLEHVDDPARFVAELARIGRPGALYYISVPDPASEDLIRHVAPQWYWHPPFHRRIFGHHQLDTLLREGGLQVEQRERGGSYQTIRWLLWWTLGRDPYDLAEDAALMKIWDRMWSAMMSSPHSGTLRRMLEETIPKSQIVLASKPGASLPTRIRRMMAGRVLNRLKRRVRSGSLRIGGLKLTWSLDRDRRDDRPYLGGN